MPPSRDSSENEELSVADDPMMHQEPSFGQQSKPNTNPNTALKSSKQQDAKVGSYNKSFCR